MRVYEKVRVYIDEKGYKQVNIAQKAGIPKATFNAILNGKRTLYVGYSIAKPDRHICRILGADCLACSDKKTVPAFEAIDIVAAIAAELQKSAAEVDYILWSYCAKGYGAVCTLQSPKCEICVAKKHCRRG